jgi:uncharacterized protein
MASKLAAAAATAPEPLLAPSAGAARIADVDVIRGVALLGVLLSNLVDAFRVPFPFDGPGGPMPQGLDRGVSIALGLIVRGKAFSLFSILFGVGLTIFLERASASHPHPLRLLARRLVLLFAFGLAHMLLVWHGDILTSYAVGGLLVLGFIRRRAAVLWIAIALSFVAQPLLIWCLMHGGPPGGGEGASSHAAADALRVYGSGHYLQIVAFRAREMRHVYFGSFFPVISTVRIWGNMLIGILIWRSGVFRRVAAWRPALRWSAGGGIVLGLAFPIYRQLRFLLSHAPPARPHPGLMLVGQLSGVVLALGYAAALLLLLQRPRSRDALMRFAPIGRMAFTNYLMQSIVFSTVFYGYGFALLGKVGIAPAVAIGLGFYVLQGIASAIWLRRFRFGPFEWAWRCLTYGALQPMR